MVWPLCGLSCPENSRSLVCSTHCNVDISLSEELVLTHSLLPNIKLGIHVAKIVLVDFKSESVLIGQHAWHGYVLDLGFSGQDISAPQWQMAVGSV